MLQAFSANRQAILATYQMIADVDKSLRTLLARELHKLNSDIDIKFDQPTREWSARLTRPTVNLFLYNVRENATLRQHQWQAINGNGHSSRGPRPVAERSQKKRLPFRIDLTYMISAWGAHPEDEHMLLSMVLMSLFRFPILPQEILEPGLKAQPVDIRAELGAAEKLANPAEIWGSLNNDIKPIVPYVLTISLDPWDVVHGPMVTQFEVRARQAKNLPLELGTAENEIAFRSYFIGGSVRNRENDPLEGIDVAIKGSGWMAKTNADGLFRLGGLPAGEHTILAWPSNGKKPQERQIALSGDPLEAAQELDFVL